MKSFQPRYMPQDSQKIEDNRDIVLVRNYEQLAQSKNQGKEFLIKTPNIIITATKDPIQSENSEKNKNEEKVSEKNIPIKRDSFNTKMRKMLKNHQCFSNLPPKLLQNGLRTTRVNILSQLEKSTKNCQNAKQELKNVLFRHTKEKVGRDLFDEKGNMKRKNFSEIQIGQQIFFKQIISNVQFHKYLEEIFSSDKLYQIDKARKNANSQVDFGKRIEILKKIMSIYHIMFLEIVSQRNTEGIKTRIENGKNVKQFDQTEGQQVQSEESVKNQIKVDRKVEQQAKTKEQGQTDKTSSNYLSTEHWIENQQFHHEWVIFNPFYYPIFIQRL